jgi:hypothetical protein
MVQVAVVAPAAIAIGDAQVVEAMSPPTVGTDDKITDKPPAGAATDEVTVMVATLPAESAKLTAEVDTDTDGVTGAASSFVTVTATLDGAPTV